MGLFARSVNPKTMFTSWFIAYQTLIGNESGLMHHMTHGKLAPVVLRIRFSVKELPHHFAYVCMAVFRHLLKLTLFGLANPHIEAGRSLLAHYASIRLLGNCTHRRILPV